MSPEPVDYNELAKQAGAISSTPAGGRGGGAPIAPAGGGRGGGAAPVDYTQLAKQSGAISSTPAAVQHGVGDQARDNQPDNSALTRFGGGVYDSTVAPVVQAVKHPIDTAVGTVKTLIGTDDLQKIHAALKAGNYGAAGLLAGKYITDAPGRATKGQSDPIVEAIQKGDYARATGLVTGSLGSAVAPELVERTPLKNVEVSTPAIKNPNPTEAAALDYLQQKGVPVPAGAATGNQFVKNIQKTADVTPLGAVVAQRSEHATTEALRTEASNLADRAHPTPVVPEQAGAGVRKTLDKAVGDRAQEAQTSYQQFREIERDNPMPVDVADIKEQLRPIYADMKTWMQPALRNASAGFQALKSIIEGPDVLPASQAEVGLGGLKALARESSGRNSGLAKFLVPKLQDEIDATVAAKDPHALIELRAGRSSAAAQYGTQAILDDIRQEPVQAFGQMTYAKDAGIDLLRKVQAEAPGEMKKVGRAWLENAFEQAQKEGGFGHSAKLYNDWANLGPETKKILFNPMLVPDLDKFFLGAKKLAENPNPSGTALLSISGGAGALIYTSPSTGIPLVIGAGALSKMLHSPAGVRALTNGTKIGLKGPARAAAATQILRMAGDDLQPAPPEDPADKPDKH